MVGGMFAFLFLTSRGMSYIQSLLLILLFLGVLGVIVERVVISPLRGKNAQIFTLIISTIAIGIILRESAALTFGRAQYPVPPVRGLPPAYLGNIMVSPQNIATVAVLLVLVLLLWWFFNKTLIGIAIRAGSFNSKAATLMGIKVSSLVTVTFILSAWISGIAGLLLTPKLGVYAYMGPIVGTKGFVAAIIGGMGHPFAALVGGILLGLFEVFTAYYISSSFYEVLTFLLLILVLMYRPTGLFAEREA